MSNESAVIDFNQYRKAPQPQALGQNGFMPVIIGYYPIYAYVPVCAENSPNQNAPKQVEPNENNVVSIYDYLGEI